MKIYFFALVLFLVSCAHQTAPSHKDGASILQLVTTETATEFSVLLKKGQEARFITITPSGETVVAAETKISERPFSEWVMHHVRFAQLPSDKGDFQFVVEVSGRILDKRTFRLFANQGERLRFIIGSCSDIRVGNEQGPMWATVAEQKPEWLFIIGDNVYAAQTEKEIDSAELLWQRYVDSRQALDLYRMKVLIPVHAVWDDNDYGQKDGGINYTLKEEAQNTFRSFFMPVFPSENLVLGPGVSSRLLLRGMHFSFLDDRSFRDPTPEGEHFGLEQEAWLFQDLKTAQLPTWIISGDQFFGGYHKYDSYEGRHPRAFENFIKQLKEIATPFVFISGDRHMTEIMQFPRALLGQLSFEFTSSPFHGKIFPGVGVGDANPWRVVARDDSLNFMRFDTWLEDNSWNLHLSSRNQKNEELFHRELSLTTEALKDFTIEKKQKRRRYRRARWRRR